MRINFLQDTYNYLDIVKALIYMYKYLLKVEIYNVMMVVVETQ